MNNALQLQARCLIMAASHASDVGAHAAAIELLEKVAEIVEELTEGEREARRAAATAAAAC
jgi:hypothetical protein